jgi:integrase/recombinase XerD
VSLLAPTMEAFFTERLANQRRASPHTVASYCDCFRLLLGFIAETTGMAPSALDFEDVAAPVIGAFLDHLEADRGASVTTRNARLAALRSLFSYAALRHPEHAGLIARVLAIPPKRVERNVVCFLTRLEVEALLASPDRSSWLGRRDHALLLVAIQTGLRVSELAGLNVGDISLGTGAHLRCRGKGRKQRCTPLTSQTVAALRCWLAERGGAPGDPLFPGPGGGPLGRDAVRKLVSKHAACAAQRCPSIKAKSISPHTLRHTCAMTLLQAGVDTSVIALYLGHETTATTHIYLHADLGLKERALAKTAPPGTAAGRRYQPPDSLLAFLESL